MIFASKRSIKHFDWISFGLACLLTCIGLLFVMSTTSNSHSMYSIYFKKQIFGALVGIGIYFFCSILDHRFICRTGYLGYFFTVAILLLTIIKGSVGMGAKRWINVGLFKFQPSELAKLFFPMFVTYFFLNDHEVTEPKQSTFIVPIAIMMVSGLLVLKQPDLGTALILFFSGFLMLWLIGLSKKFFLIAGIIGIIAAPVLWTVVLKDYQKKRVLVFLGQGHKQHERYQIEQSKIAVGSGGFFGKGILQGTQNKLSFLPESRTDFIFSIICEETGFFGACLIILLYLLFFGRIFLLISTIQHFYSQLLCTGLAIHLLFSSIINIGMVLDMLPIVGIPLPFISYGITHLWISFASLGCINSITSQRFAFDN